MTRGTLYKLEIVIFALVVTVGAVAICSRAPLLYLKDIKIKEPTGTAPGTPDPCAGAKDEIEQLSIGLDLCLDQLDSHRQQAEQCIAEKLRIKDNKTTAR